MFYLQLKNVQLIPPLIDIIIWPLETSLIGIFATFFLLVIMLGVYSLLYHTPVHTLLWRQEIFILCTKYSYKLTEKCVNRISIWILWYLFVNTYIDPNSVKFHHFIILRYRLWSSRAIKWYMIQAEKLNK